MCGSSATNRHSALDSGAIANFATHVSPALPDAYTTEHLSLRLSVRTVPSLTAAIAHINAHGSHHMDCIVTESAASGSAFIRGVNWGGVFVNASTHFADGFRYGFGAEVGVSTGRIHARGHVVGEFGGGQGKRQYTRQPIRKTELPF